MTTRNKQVQKRVANRVRDLEIALEEERSLSRARNILLEKNIEELNEVYVALNDKLKTLRIREERIKGFEAQLVRANKLSSLGELAGSIAHEIKNPLIAIQGFAKRISNEEDTVKVGRNAGLIEKEAGRLAKVLAKLLDFSRMDEPKTEEYDLNDIVEDTVLFMEHHLTRFKNVGVEVLRSPEPAIVHIDTIHIQQALVNLINNAAQSMPNGGIIKISSGKQNGFGFISVADEGGGIDEETLGRIFEPFFTTKARGEGTGLGLPLSKRLLEANGGSIDIQTTPGKGSTFRMLLPLIKTGDR
ncbi:MAG: ATP-binding protein [Syntrophorhabdaceae bacterium]|nr:ATP-binding protein [Syntrophorhabdaceae bacterium]